jgi:hypothetical protein
MKFALFSAIMVALLVLLGGRLTTALGVAIAAVAAFVLAEHLPDSSEE